MRRTFARRALAPVVVIAALAGCGGGGGGGSADYEVTELRSGDAVSVESLRGHPVVLVSWATWCRECDEELAGLQEFASSPEASGVEIVAVNIDAGDATEAIDEKVAEHGLTTRLWRDRRNEFKAAFGALGVPTTVLLDAEGEVVGLYPGAIDFEDGEVLEALAALRDP